MKILTENIRQAIRQGWRVGIKENNYITVFEVVSRLGSHIKGDEKWVLYPKTEKKEDGPIMINPRLFIDLDISQLVYCHSRSNGQEYIDETMLDQFI